MDIKEYKRQYYQKNKEYINKKNTQWYKNNIDHKKEYDKEYCQKNKDKKNEQSKQWYENNPEKVKEIGKKYRQNHREELRKRQKEFLQNHKLEINIYKKEYKKNKRKTDLKFNLNEKIKNAVGKALKGNKNGRHWEDLVGYTLKDLIKRLKLTIPEGYNWQDCIEGRLHLEHKIPISVFNFTKAEHIDFKNCWDLNNLRLLPARENLIKSNKLAKPFQPALCLEF